MLTAILDFRPDQKIERKEYITLFDLKRLGEVIALDAISVLKIDVEGAELEVLSSFKDLIKEQQPIILIEILPAYEADNTFRVERQDNIQRILAEADYLIYRVIKENDILLDLDLIPEIGIHGDINLSEYVMVPNSKQAEFEKRLHQQLGG